MNANCAMLISLLRQALDTHQITNVHLREKPGFYFTFRCDDQYYACACKVQIKLELAGNSLSLA